MAAEKIKGLELYVSRDALPDPNEEEFYYSDLIGLDVEDEGGKMIGQVKMMDNYGAGEVMEVTLSSGEALLLPFTRKVVPVVDVAAGKIQIVRPTEVNPGQEEVVNDEGTVHEQLGGEGFNSVSGHVSRPTRLFPCGEGADG